MQHFQPMHNLNSEQKDLIQSLKNTIKDGEFLRSYLLIGARHLLNKSLLNALAQFFLCANNNCNTCKNCRLIAADFHPDLQYISNQDSNAIKIESIRELQLKVTQSLSVAKYKLVIINPADKLNIQSASALLKILEEPPMHTIFVLLAEQLSSIPVTVISRCHKYYMRDYSLNNIDTSYFNIATYYANDDERSLLVAKKTDFLNELLNLINDKISVCDIAEKFQDYKFENVLWFLYLITAELLNVAALGKVLNNEPQIQKLANSQSMFALYKQLDVLHAAQKMQMENITLNSSLAIENILLGYKHVS